MVYLGSVFCLRRPGDGEAIERAVLTSATCAVPAPTLPLSAQGNRLRNCCMMLKSMWRCSWSLSEITASAKSIRSEAS